MYPLSLFFEVHVLLHVMDPAYELPFDLVSMQAQYAPGGKLSPLEESRQSRSLRAVFASFIV